MILFLSPYQNATECAALIESATKQKVKTVDCLKLALAALRNSEFDAVVADENLLGVLPEVPSRWCNAWEAQSP